jgi:hypothetical protein
MGSVTRLSRALMGQPIGNGSSSPMRQNLAHYRHARGMVSSAHVGHGQLLCQIETPALAVSNAVAEVEPLMIEGPAAQIRSSRQWTGSHGGGSATTRWCSGA